MTDTNNTLTNEQMLELHQLTEALAGINGVEAKLYELVTYSNLEGDARDLLTRAEAAINAATSDLINLKHGLSNPCIY